MCTTPLGDRDLSSYCVAEGVEEQEAQDCLSFTGVRVGDTQDVYQSHPGLESTKT